MLQVWNLTSGAQVRIRCIRRESAMSARHEQPLRSVSMTRPGQKICLPDESPVVEVCESWRVDLGAGAAMLQHTGKFNQILFTGRSWAASERKLLNKLAS